MEINKKIKYSYSAFSFFESAFLIAAIFSIAAVSVLGVMILNPKTDSTNTAGRVAGVEVDENLELKIENYYNKRRHDVTFDHNELERQGNIYAHIRSLPQGQTISDFLKISNPNSQDFTLKLNTTILGYTNDLIDIYIIQNGVELKLYDRVSSQNSLEIEITKNSEETLQIKYDAAEKINFSFDVEIKFEY